MGGSSSDKETNTNKMSSRIHAEKGNSLDEECDDLNDSHINEYKELSYRLFQFRTYRLRGSNGDIGCPFCGYKEMHQQYQYVRLLLHAIQVGESSESGKQRANHLAMAKYLVIDLADDVKAEADRLSSGEGGKKLKRPKLDEDSSKGNMDASDKVRQLERELNEKKDEMNDFITRERQRNDELQGARRELIKGVNDILKGNHDNIGIKYIGEIDSKAFISEMEKWYSPKDAVIEGFGLCSLWQEKLKDPQWYPYQIIEDDNGKPRRLLKEDDESLQDLKKEWGQQVHDAVVVAMNELQEYNPSGCYVVPELWNFNENRKAKLDEVISYILEAVKDVSKMVSTSEINNSRVEEHRERGRCLSKQRDTNVSRINDSYEESDASERTYKLLKSFSWKMRSPSGQLTCPFCFIEEDKEHNYDYLLSHALTVAENSSESAEQRVNHFALVKYCVVDLKYAAESAPQSTRASKSVEDDIEIVRETRALDTSQEDVERKRLRLDDEKRKEKALQNLLKENKELERSNQNLLAREQNSKAELQGTRIELIKGLKDWPNGNKSGIGIKQMGEIDVNVFKRVCSKRFRVSAETGAEALYSLWQQKLENPQWRPFRMVEDDKGNLEMVVEEDNSLCGLKHSWGDEIYTAVVTALKDLCEYNPSGRRRVAEIWNFKENRKAKLEEVIRYVFTQSKENNNKSYPRHPSTPGSER